MFSKLKKRMRLEVDPVVFWGASIIIWTILTASFVDEKWSERFWSQLYGFTSEYFGWLYLLAVGFFLALCAFLAISPFGKVRLGKDSEKPEYSFGSWLSMLFSAGMGIGLVFNCVSEPVTHFNAPPVDLGTASENASQAMKVTYLHWGLHAWGIYAMVGLCIAYFHFRKGKPLSLRHTLTPLIGEKKVNGPIGYAVDILAIVGTLFGVAASLGYGSAQISSGLSHLYGAPKEDWFQVVVIVTITAIAMISVVSGLNKGIKYLSQLNMVFAVLLLAFVLFAGPSMDIFYALIRSFGDYIQELPRLTFNPAGSDNHEWLRDWTLSYWGWWIAWAPFVGMFIARISRGRTIREFLIGATIAPSLLTFLWMSTFGEQALAFIQSGAGGLAEQIQADKTKALFVFLEHFPYPSVVSFIAVCLVATFFITSSDSGSLVIDMLASGGKENPPIKQKVYWASLEGAVAAALILIGGLGAVQSAALNAAVPFCIIMLFMCWALVRALKSEEL